MKATSVDVTVHVAQSLDGRLALRGTATPLSTPEGQRSAHAARAEHDAVLVGVGTVRIDDPRLTVRHGFEKQPLRVVLASQLDVSKNARVLSRPTQREARTLVIGARDRASSASLHAARDALMSAGVDVSIATATSDGMVSLPDALRILEERGVKKLLVEGGARVLTSFFREGLVHHVEIEIAMVMLGDPGTAMFGALGVIDGLERAPKLANVTVERLGTSILVRGDVASSSSSS